MSTTILEPGRLAHVKTAYTTRHVDLAGLATLVDGDTVPRSGDLLLARVVEIGHHKKIERPTGRLATLFVGDEIVVCYGHRYAPDQFEAEVPESLATCHLVAGGGVASQVLAGHASMNPPTVLEPVGLLGDRGGCPVNLRDYALPHLPTSGPRPVTITVVGTAMNSGKTDAVAHLVRGLRLAGRRVGVAKVTGTGAGKDLWLMTDAGADPVLDFTSAGYPSTYHASTDEIEDIFSLLMGHLCAAGVDAIVLEVADGVYQQETADLVTSRRFADSVDGMLFAAGDALGAAAGVTWLQERGLPVVGVSGLLTASPLAMREALETIGLPVFGRGELASPEIVATLQEHLTARFPVGVSSNEAVPIRGSSEAPTAVGRSCGPLWEPDSRLSLPRSADGGAAAATLNAEAI